MTQDQPLQKTAACPRCEHSYDKHHVMRQPTGDCPLCTDLGQRCELVNGTVLEYLQWAIRSDARRGLL